MVPFAKMHFSIILDADNEHGRGQKFGKKEIVLSSMTSVISS